MQCTTQRQLLVIFMKKKSQMDNPDFYSNFLGSSTANVALVFILAIALYVRRRLRVSKCASHCGIFDCEAQLQELQHVKAQVNTQRGMLQNVLEILDGNSVAARARAPSIVIPDRTPEKKNGK